MNNLPHKHARIFQDAVKLPNAMVDYTSRCSTLRRFLPHQYYCGLSKSSNGSAGEIHESTETSLGTLTYVEVELVLSSPADNTVRQSGLRV